MRTINYAGQFKKDYRREKSGSYGKRLDALLEEAFRFLCADIPLPERYCDHDLKGEWREFRDCI